ncbi:MAG TPA: hypothetical protein P5210_11565 [Draconibacterium sp.]|nr:hypothetical protein [Draconibacterium sp.]
MVINTRNTRKIQNGIYYWKIAETKLTSVYFYVDEEGHYAGRDPHFETTWFWKEQKYRKPSRHRMFIYNLKKKLSGKEDYCYIY